MSMPERTCVVCRKKGDKTSMVRFVANIEEADGEDKVVFDRFVRSFAIDVRYRLPGRGAYCHIDPGSFCLGSVRSLSQIFFSLVRRDATREERKRFAKYAEAAGVKVFLEKLAEASEKLALANAEKKRSSMQVLVRDAHDRIEQTLRKEQTKVGKRNILL